MWLCKDVDSAQGKGQVGILKCLYLKRGERAVVFGNGALSSKLIECSPFKCSLHYRWYIQLQKYLAEL